MVFADVHPLVLLVWSLAIATTAVFAWLTVSNLASLRRLDDSELRLYAAFTAAGALDAALVAGTFLPLEEGVKARLFLLMWGSGTVSVGLWMRAVTRFVGAGDHRVIRWLSRGMFAVGGVVFSDFLASLFTGTSAMFVFEPRGSPSILVLASGDVFRHRPLADLVSLVAILAVLVSSVVLFAIVRRHRPGELLVQLGIIFTALCACTQAGLAGTNSPYTAPLLFIANLVEAMRITWVSRARISEQLGVVRRKQEEQSIFIDHQLEQLQFGDRMAKLGENTARVSHDLRNPLGSVLASIELAELELAEPELDRTQLREWLSFARASIEHTLVLVRRITNQARTDLSAPAQALHLRGILDDSLSLCRQRIEGVKVELELPPQLEVHGRSTELIQLFVNLISNACDALSGLESRWIRIEAHAHAGGEAGQVEITVTDAGLRPPESIVARMFKERFTTRMDADGTGLGLSICARIVKQHGGSIMIDSKAPHTTIRVSLPTAPGRSVGREPTRD